MVVVFFVVFWQGRMMMHLENLDCHILLGIWQGGWIALNQPSCEVRKTPKVILLSGWHCHKLFIQELPLFGLRLFTARILDVKFTEHEKCGSSLPHEQFAPTIFRQVLSPSYTLAAATVHNFFIKHSKYLKLQNDVKGLQDKVKFKPFDTWDQWDIVLHMNNQIITIN